ncbi:hypothetical protein EMO92_10335 [Bifidobacterium reuteri]|uniref:LPXTG cell wall anchor domain-containing protein n=1 Tax=Bifidobacterium reuteri TaxID=983706 RepID=A0A5J5E2B0_9BIFI|nr:hypothetical protein [Bifidobacterium reuteri]KAA8823207.1 hypothetical protein EMO92_10335 [Bifidobacterium reuteri]
MEKVFRGGVRLLAALIIAALAAVAMPHVALADEATQITVPAGTQKVWVDIETPASLTYQGTADNNGSKQNLNFKASPSGATAIADAAEGKIAFALSASEKTDVLLAITFVDGNGAVLAESATDVTLDKTPTNVEPTVPVVPTNPSKPKPVAHKNTGLIGNTGSAVMLAVLAAAALAAAGFALYRVKMMKGAAR